ncbi:MAG: biopolymer transporter ExbD [Flavobacteriaceae bacterium]|nr:biopolymer transporter ExbD [Flavobacteriaceae bacterium]
MPKVKIPRKSTLIDMTAMVDMGFLLVTFFMLATKFKPEDPVEVDTPSSSYTEVNDDKDIIMITVSKDGRVFFGMDNQGHMAEILERVVQGAHGYKVTAEDKKIFAKQSTIGVPIANMQQWLALPTEEQKNQPGIPTDSLGGELYEWIFNARRLNPKGRILIKADGETNYPVIKNVINVLANEKMKAFKFNLVTDLEESRMK